MSTHAIATRETLSELAEKMVQRYVRGLLTADELVERIKLACQASGSANAPGEPTLETLARGLCSQALCEACRLVGGRARDLAFERLSEYLERVLSDMGGTFRYAASEVRQEVLQCTLVEILRSLQRERGKPAQPMAFLGWARVILYRQRVLYWRQKPPVELLSLENQDEPQLANMIDVYALDPSAEMLRHELRADLCTAIAKLRNPKYRTVLLTLYFGELEVREVADLLHAPVDDIYLWHHRALHALHKQLGGIPVKPQRA